MGTPANGARAAVIRAHPGQTRTWGLGKPAFPLLPSRRGSLGRFLWPASLMPRDRWTTRHEEGAACPRGELVCDPLGLGTCAEPSLDSTVSVLGVRGDLTSEQTPSSYGSDRERVGEAENERISTRFPKQWFLTATEAHAPRFRASPEEASGRSVGRAAWGGKWWSLGGHARL